MNRAAVADRRRTRTLRGTVLAVALLNGAYLVVEIILAVGIGSVSYTHLRAHETGRNLVCRLLLEKKKNKQKKKISVCFFFYIN